ncbi:hypothetical protein ABFS83_04G028900 [Erythranthe nasuta]
MARLINKFPGTYTKCSSIRHSVRSIWRCGQIIFARLKLIAAESWPHRRRNPEVEEQGPLWHGHVTAVTEGLEHSRQQLSKKLMNLLGGYQGKDGLCAMLLHQLSKKLMNLLEGIREKMASAQCYVILA